MGGVVLRYMLRHEGYCGYEGKISGGEGCRGDEE